MASYFDQYVRPIVETPNPLATDTNKLRAWLKLPTGKYLELKESDGNTIIDYIKMCNYAECYMDIIKLRFRMEFSQYQREILDNGFENNLEIYIYMNGVEDNVYKARINSSASNIEGTNNKISHLPSDVGSVGYITVVADCYLREAEVYRTAFVDGVYHNTNPIAVIAAETKRLLGKCAIENKPIDATIMAHGFKSDNSFTNIIVPTGTRLLELCKYFQHGDYGVYDGGINAYLTKIVGETPEDDKVTVFIYPLYDGNRFDEAERRLVLVRNDMPQYNLQDNTFRVYETEGQGSSGKQTTVEILVTSKSTYQDDAENPLMDHRVASVTSYDLLAGETVPTTSNGEYRVSTKNTMATLHATGQPMDEVNNYNYFGYDVNPERISSLAAKSMSSKLTLEWRFADPTLLIPGMPVRYIYKRNGEAVITTGTLLSAVYRYTSAGKTMIALLNVSLDKVTITSEPVEGIIKS